MRCTRGVHFIRTVAAVLVFFFFFFFWRRRGVIVTRREQPIERLDAGDSGRDS